MLLDDHRAALETVGCVPRFICYHFFSEIHIIHLTCILGGFSEYELLLQGRFPEEIGPVFEPLRIRKLEPHSHI